MKVKLYLLSACLVLAGTGLGYFMYGPSLIGIDDANIYMVYMRNFANSHGFVYNQGGERVEGFTSLLWTLLGSLYYLIADPIGPLLIITNILAISYTIYRFLNYIAKSSDFESKWPSILLFSGLIIVIPGYFSWTILALLETGIWASVLSLSLLFLLEEKEKTTTGQEVYFLVLMILLILIRPESLLWGLFFVGMRGLRRFWESGDVKTSIKAMLPGLLVYLVCLASLVSWRLSYFGFPLPNTFYAKVSGDKIHNLLYGGFYLYKNFLHNPLLLLTLLLGVFCFKRIRKDFHLIILALFFALTLFIPLYTGGDHFGMGRFIQPSMLGIYLLLTITLVQIRKPKLTEILGVLVFFSFCSQHTWYESILFRSDPISHEFSLSKSGRDKANVLNDFFLREDDGYPEVGVLTAGGTAYAYKGETNDLLGLNNVEMAHFKSDPKLNTGPKNHSGFKPEVFFEQEPDIFFLALEILDNDDPKLTDSLKIGEFSREVFKFIDIHPDFEKEFEAVVISSFHHDFSIRTFASKDFLKTLDPEDYTYQLIPFK